MATKAEQIFEEINQMVDGGMAKADAFKQMAEEQSRPVDSIRGAYYGYKRKIEGGTRAPRTRRRETTADDAVADARAALERSIASIDKEVEVAEERAKEAVAEAKSLKDSAAERKKAIAERLESLK
jgi:multidrug resistance efflux pump